MDCLFDSYSVVDLRCLEGRSLPPGTKFFQFHAVFGKCSKIVCWRLPPRVDAPTSGKSWIAHCYWLFVWISHHEVWALVRVLSVSINFPHCPSLTYSTFDPNWWFGWVSHSSGDLRFICTLRAEWDSQRATLTLRRGNANHKRFIIYSYLPWWFLDKSSYVVLSMVWSWF